MPIIDDETRIDIAGHLTKAFFDDLLVVAETRVWWFGTREGESWEGHDEQALADFLEKAVAGRRGHLSCWFDPEDDALAAFESVCVAHRVAFHTVVEPTYPELSYEGAETHLFLPDAGMTEPASMPIHRGSVRSSHVVDLLRSHGPDETADMIVRMSDALALLPDRYSVDPEVPAAIREDMFEMPVWTPDPTAAGDGTSERVAFGFRPKQPTTLD